MIFANILAGGIGSRMANDIPKQFIKLDEKEIIFYSLDIFLSIDYIEKIVISVNKEWYDYLEKLIEKRYNKEKDKIILCNGGILRNDSILNAISKLKETYKFCKNDVLITHDAARPFIDKYMIDEQVSKINDECRCVVSAVETIDTMLIAESGIVSSVLKRDNMYNVQTPQTIDINIFVKEYIRLSDADKKEITDASKIFVLNNYNVKVSKGDFKNIKITTPLDLIYAKMIKEYYISEV